MLWPRWASSRSVPESPRFRVRGPRQGIVFPPPPRSSYPIGVHVAKRTQALGVSRGIVRLL
jgi:hypothetical protein